MPRKTSVLSFRLHKASAHAFTIVNGRHIYLKKYGSTESRQRYARILTLPYVSPQIAAMIGELLETTKKDGLRN